eukprot:CAMPEP_0114327516 /NCGR_PEP_ID=MMETSP0059-20121206/30339_1 /TAXON_ID=36894 /ORGANISM="Pyramimonas parkeae, Strain CCMP726" /LENGTH=297 /DNA_ID=CAMNT_0001456641 /DNA_START=1 /DNA_END=894 /DNA_ORIENTATION=+
MTFVKSVSVAIQPHTFKDHAAPRRVRVPTTCLATREHLEESSRYRSVKKLDVMPGGVYRRLALRGISGYCALQLLPPFTGPAWAFDDEVAGASGFTSRIITDAKEAPKSAAPASTIRSFITRDYMFKYDTTEFEQEALSETYQPSSTIGSNPQLLYGSQAAPKNPLEVKIVSKDGLSASVAVRIASTVKQTLLQVSDITMLGDAQEVAALVVPPGSTVTAYAALERNSPPRPGKDTVLPRQYYTYKFKRGNLSGYLMAAAKKGKVYVMLAGGDSEIAELPENDKRLRKIVDSFVLRQ